jgi:UDP-N-acetylmuramate--alanine ligase
MAGIFGEINKRVHFIGIGGIGMSGIAHLALCRGVKVSGSDLKESRATEELRKLGAAISIGHDPRNIQDVSLVVYSSAIKADNPEMQEARAKGIPIIKRAQALAQLMNGETVITVAGSHGKTTTTSLVSYLLLEAGLSPTVAIGGIFKNIDSNVYSGRGGFFIAEADESDGTFLYYEPRYSIITNIDREHLDYYKDFQNEVEAFKEFINRTKSAGCVFCCADDINLKGILKSYEKRYVLFGLDQDADIYPKNIQMRGLTSEFDCYYRVPRLGKEHRFLDRFYLALGGKHNISNALSVIGIGIELGIDLKIIKLALSQYQGAARRLEIKFKGKDVLILDDYAHHPTEIKATLAAARNLDFKRMVVIFQPHRYTRTKLLLDEFSQSFDLTDCLILTDIYPASEPPIEGVSGESIYNKIKERLPGKTMYFLPKEKIKDFVLNNIQPQDLIITLGAGDIVKVNDELVEELKR